MTVLEHALAYARRGCRVFPLHGIVDGGCTCRAGTGCPHAGKHPWGDGWQTHATTVPAQIRRWCRHHPDMNLGVVTGAPSNQFVLDVDPAKGGDESLRDLERVHGALPETPIVLTGGGGRHLGFQHPGTPVPNSVGMLGPGLDVRGDGGFVVGVGSRHRSGRTYAWEVTAHPDEVALASAPPWLLARVRDRASDRLRADGTPLVLREGARNDGLFRRGAWLRRYGANEAALRDALTALNREHCQPPLPADELTRIAESAARYAPEDRGIVPNPPEASFPTSHQREPWTRAMTAAAFVAESDLELDWLEPRLLALGSITEWFSPRGLGKTQAALAIAVKLARAGHRVLLLDRDNSRREVRRRLRAWGAADVTTLRVMTRHDVPPLTDGAAWKTFPFGDYELVIVDSLDASTEGVGEKDSGKPSQAIAPLLDIAHRADGPAILVLGNTIKSGTHGRGSGVVEDRADISYEVRDATDLHPTGTKPWWLELPAAGREDWASWAARRHRRVRYRLAFVASKFRIGEEPDPFVLEVDLASEPWQLREVTADIEQVGQAACASEAERRVQAQEAAVDRLAAEVTRREVTAEPPLNLTAAVDVLHADGSGVPRDAARMLLDREQGTRWRLVEDKAQRGHPTLVVGVNQEWPPEKSLFSEPLSPQGFPTGPFSPDHVPQRPEKTNLAQSLGTDGVPDGAFSPAEPPNTPPREPLAEDVEVF
jgi:Bifunctional DNA primase/polymerase, N-terminal/AAA domain/Primase C terminal 1 (PriCT-1)